jgi:hypothetical protein
VLPNLLTTMASDTCTLVADVNLLLAKQTTQLQHVELPAYVALKSGYMNLVGAGTTPSGMGEEITTVIADPVSTNLSLTEPVFVDAIDACGTAGTEAKWGNRKYTTALKNLRGRTPPVCLKQNFFALKGVLGAAINNLKSIIASHREADIRANLVRLSGVKAVMNASRTMIHQTLNGEYGDISSAFNGDLPNAAINRKYVTALGAWLRDELDGQPFGNGNDEHYVLIASNDALEKLRGESGIRADILASVAGNGAAEKKATLNYQFIDYNYRGVKFAQDKQPLRFNFLTAAGYPVWIEPKRQVASDDGYKLETNPAWRTAQFECALMVAKDAFKILYPERYSLKEGGANLGPQFVMGELEWFNPKDSCNEWGDFGWWHYQVERAIQALAPHTVIPVLFKRCTDDLGMDVCTDFDTSDDQR